MVYYVRNRKGGIMAVKLDLSFAQVKNLVNQLSGKEKEALAKYLGVKSAPAKKPAAKKPAPKAKA